MRYVTLLAFAITCAGQELPPGMKCEPRTLVRYTPGAAVSTLKDHYSGHVQYIADQLKSGAILFAGPAEDGTALAVFRSTSNAEVEKTVRRDPFVANGVMMFKISGWRHCTATP